MKHLNAILFILVLGLSNYSIAIAQGFQPPSEGKSVVYFTRINSTGSMVNFKYYDYDKFIGKFKGKNYMRYECSPGEHLFWASAESKDFITAELEEGKTYIIAVEGKMGMMSAGVMFLTTEDERKLKRALTIINKKAPIVMSQEEIDNENQELEEYIATKLSKYENEWKEENENLHISPDMFIPTEKLK